MKVKGLIDLIKIIEQMTRHFTGSRQTRGFEQLMGLQLYI
jgi:hypothetical protein